MILHSEKSFGVLVKHLSDVSEWLQEAQSSGNGIAPHGAWRNYDDFNEFFWSGLWTLPIVTCAQFSTEFFLCQEFPVKLDK
jgi:hypothetical protein